MRAPIANVVPNRGGWFYLGRTTMVAVVLGPRPLFRAFTVGLMTVISESELQT